MITYIRIAGQKEPYILETNKSPKIRDLLLAYKPEYPIVSYYLGNKLISKYDFDEELPINEKIVPQTAFDNILDEDKLEFVMYRYEHNEMKWPPWKEGDLDPYTNKLLGEYKCRGAVYVALEVTCNYLLGVRDNNGEIKYCNRARFFQALPIGKLGFEGDDVSWMRNMKDLVDPRKRMFLPLFDIRTCELTYPYT